eukprot:scaffold1946_cov116-Skeletonema_marinoi.AAC.2
MGCDVVIWWKLSTSVKLSTFSPCCSYKATNPGQSAIIAKKRDRIDKSHQSRTSSLKSDGTNYLTQPANSNSSTVPGSVPMLDLIIELELEVQVVRGSSCNIALRLRTPTMVGFGQSIRDARRQGWEGAYLDYERLKDVLHQMQIECDKLESNLTDDDGSQSSFIQQYSELSNQFTSNLQQELKRCLYSAYQKLVALQMQ